MWAALKPNREQSEPPGPVAHRPCPERVRRRVSEAARGRPWRPGAPGGARGRRALISRGGAGRGAEVRAPARPCLPTLEALPPSLARSLAPSRAPALPPSDSGLRAGKPLGWVGGRAGAPLPTQEALPPGRTTHGQVTASQHAGCSPAQAQSSARSGPLPAPRPVYRDRGRAGARKGPHRGPVDVPAR